METVASPVNDAAVPASDLSTDALRTMVRKMGLERQARTPVEKLSRYQLLNVLVTHGFERLLAGSQNVTPAPAGSGVAADLREMVRAEVAEATRNTAATPAGPTVVIKRPNVADVKIRGTMHRALPDVLRLAVAGVPVLLVGPAGSGKTHLASQVAKALELPFTFNSLSAGCTESHLIGRVLPQADGSWQYQPSPFVRTYRDGGVHLFDEVDAADPNLLVLINAALSNGHLSIPFTDQPPVQRHENTCIIAAANTFGFGADAEYVGRNQLDAATLDRYSVSTVFIDYDAEMERSLVGCVLPSSDAKRLLDWGWGVRGVVQKNRLRRIVSTRTLLNGARVLAAGDPFESIVSRFFQSWTESEREMVPANLLHN